jgi:hypothetical protein
MAEGAKGVMSVALRFRRDGPNLEEFVELSMEFLLVLERMAVDIDCC